MAGGLGGGGGLFVDVGLMLVESRTKHHHHHHHHHHHNHHHASTSANAAAQSSSQSAVNGSIHQAKSERLESLRRHMSLLAENTVPMCIDVFLCPDCSCGQARSSSDNICTVPSPDDLLLEQWTISFVTSKAGCSMEVDAKGLTGAIRSQLHFSQLSAWYSLGCVPPVCYRLSHPANHPQFSRPPVVHNFPVASNSNSRQKPSYLKVILKSLPRLETLPTLNCTVHSNPSPLASTVTAFKTVFAELGHCLLDPPSRIPPLKQGFLAWRDKKNVSGSDSNLDSQSSRGGNGSVRTAPLRSSSSIGRGGSVVDDRMQCGCDHIGKHHCEEDCDQNNSVEKEPPRYRSGSLGSRTTIVNIRGFGQQNQQPPPQSLLSHLSIPQQLQQQQSSLHSPSSLLEEPSLQLNHHISHLAPPSSQLVVDIVAKERLNNSKSPANHHHLLSSINNDLNMSKQSDEQMRESINNISNSALNAVLCLSNPLKRKRSQVHHTSKKVFTQGDSDKISTVSPNGVLDQLEVQGLDIYPVSGQHCHQHNQHCCDGSNESHSESPQQQSQSTPLQRICRRKVNSAAVISSQLITSFQRLSVHEFATPPPPPPLFPPRSVVPLPCPSPPVPRKQTWTDSSSEDTECESPVAKELTKVPPGILLSGGSGFSRRRPLLHLLGSFEENLLKGRIQPVSVVNGFTADVGASGSFCPKHLSLPATVSYYEPQGLSVPFLGWIRLQRKGYHVPRCGTIQVTMLNPLGTVVKMFVVGYDLTDMPVNCQTFVRQRIVSVDGQIAGNESKHQSEHLRYLIHLRFLSTKSGRILLHSDIQIVICRQYDTDATLGLDTTETNLKTLIVRPTDPKYSPRK